MNATILIACCRPLTTTHWAAKLQATPYSAITCCTHQADVLTLVAQHKPALLLIEATFDANRGFAVAQQAMITHAALRSAVFVQPGMDFWQQAIQTDVSGYLADPLDDETELLLCLDEISQRRRYISPALRHLALIPSPDVLAVVRTLKSYQRQLLKRLAQGWTARQIGIELKISEGTVRTHKENLLIILGLTSAAELKGFAGSVLGWLD